MPLGIVSQEDYEQNLGIQKESNGSETHIPEQKDAPESSTEVENNESPSDEPVRPATVEVLPAIGRGTGNTAVPSSIRKIIGESSIEEGSAAANAIGRFLGLSPSSVSAYGNGATSTASYRKPDDDLKNHLEKTRGKILKRAQGKLYKSLGVIDDDKLDALDAIEASTVARNMSAIVKNLEPDQKSGNTFNGPVITFYAPQIVNEDRFETVTVSE